MGIIQRQGIKHSIVNFTGLVIGTASTLFIYTQQEVVEAYGLVQYLLAIGIVGFPLFSLAGNTVAIRYFPHFQDKATGHHGFLMLLMLMALAAWSAFALLAAITWAELQSALAGDSALLRQYLWMALPLALFYTLAVVLGQYAFNFKRIVVPSIIIDFSLKLFLPVQMVALWLGWISLDLALWLLLGHYFLMAAAMVIYLSQLGEWHWRPDWSFLTPELRSNMIRYAAFGVATSFAILIVTKVDTLMVGTLTSVKNTAIYAIALNIAAAIEIPTKSLYSVSTSFVAKYLADENWTELRELYQKVSINLLTAGLLLFGCVWVSAADLYAIMPNSAEIAQGKYVLLFLCLTKLVDMGAGLNNQLVYYSKFYRYSAVSLGFLAVGNILFNLWLIPLLGITGAAVATLISVSSYNLFNLILVWKKFGMQPFSRNTLLVAGLAVAVLAVVWFMPSGNFPLLNIVVRSGLFALLFAFVVLRFNVSPDLNALWREFLIRVKKN